KLHLPRSAQPDRLLHRGIQHAERRARGSSGKRLSGLKLIRPGAERLIELNRRRREVYAIKQVVNFPAKLQALPLMDCEFLLQRQIELRQIRPVQYIASQIPDDPWGRYGESRRIQVEPLIAGNEERV